MGRDAIKAGENPCFQCRKEAAKYNDKLNSREGAAEMLGVSVSSLADYELGITKVTMRCKRRWREEFTEAEREKARKLFSRSHDWLLGRGVPDTVQMSVETYQLWQKLGCFCGSI